MEQQSSDDPFTPTPAPPSFTARLQAGMPLLPPGNSDRFGGPTGLIPDASLDNFPAPGSARPLDTRGPIAFQHLHRAEGPYDGTAARMRYAHGPTPLQDRTARRTAGVHHSGLQIDDELEASLARDEQNQQRAFGTDRSNTEYGIGQCQQTSVAPQQPRSVPVVASSADIAAQAIVLQTAKLDLPQPLVQDAVAFAKKDSLAAKLDEFFVRMLSMEQQLKEAKKEISNVNLKCDDVLERFRVNFKLSDEQETALRKLVLHFVAQPQSLGYDKKNIVKCCSDYISSKRSRYGFKKYTSDETVKSGTERFLGSKVSNIKSEYRKLLFSTCAAKPSLDILVGTMMGECHIPPLPATYENILYAFYALQREVATPLLSIKGQRDTQFWKNLHQELQKLVQKFRTADTKAVVWRQWALQMISDDRARYSGQEDAAIDYEEMEEVQDDEPEEPTPVVDG
ncbi:hypothetical protein GGF50DRAFT_110683 [Schizophyllum commune]